MSPLIVYIDLIYNRFGANKSKKNLLFEKTSPQYEFRTIEIDG